MPPENRYRIQRLANGDSTIHASVENECLHPGLGPEGEARALYFQAVKDSGLWDQKERNRPLILWDIGLGAAANSMIVRMEWCRQFSGDLVMHSFDFTLELLRTALTGHREDPTRFPYLASFDWESWMTSGRYEETQETKSFKWYFHEGPFEKKMYRGEWSDLPVPDMILFDPFSPTKNPDMWHLELFKLIRAHCGDHHTRLINYSRSTGFRTTLLLAGFYVGNGPSLPSKEETTLAAIYLEDLKSPLPLSWLDKVRRSHTSHPFTGNQSMPRAISEDWLTALKNHPQFIP